MSEFFDRNLHSIDPDLNVFSHDDEGRSNYYSIDDYNMLFENSMPCPRIRLINYNIRSFFANGPSFESMLQYFIQKPNFIILTETWNSLNTIDLGSFGYSGYHVFREYPKRGGGVSIFCDLNLKSKKENKFSKISEVIETCCVSVELENSYFVILGVYRPPNGDKLEFIQNLNLTLNAEFFFNAEFVIMAGDINLDLNNVECPIVNNYVNFLNSMLFFPLITRPTRFPSDLTSSDPSVIDHIWINKFSSFISGILNIDFTDHLPTFLHLSPNQNYVEKSDKIKIQFRPFSSSNLENLITILNSTNWEISTDLGGSDCVDVFIRKLNDAYCRAFPLKTKFLSKKRLEKPWLSREILSLIRQKSEYFKLYKLGIISKQTNNRFKNKVNKITLRAKNSYKLRKFESCWGKPKESWEIVKELMGQNSKNCRIEEIIVDGISYKSDVEIANKFVEFFSDVAVDLNENLPPPTTSPSSYLPNVTSFFKFFHFKESECAKIVSNLKITKSDVNFVPVRIFKQICPHIIVPLTRIINRCFVEGVFPESFKIGRINQIFKSGDPTNPSNYRPITSLPYLSKLFETCLCHRLTSYFNKFGLFTHSQFGFRKNMSTSDAIIKLTNRIYSSLNSKEYNANILIDYKKAFDTVNHTILIEKMFHYGIRGSTLTLIRNYLTGRKQYVAIGGVRSEVRDVTLGIPQGSCLGPLLFILYVNDFPQVSPVLNSILFADDTTIGFSHENFNTLVEQLNYELVRVRNWTLANRLTLNVSKTNAIIFSNRFVPDNLDFSFHLDNNDINIVQEVKFLGVYIDSKLNFRKHINCITGKIARNTGIFYRIKNSLPLKARINFYYGFIYPYLSYGVIVWGATSENHLHNLIIQQKRFIRLLADSPFLEHTTPLFSKFNLLKFEDIYKYNVCTYMYSNQNNAEFQIQHQISTRNRNRLISSFNRLGISQRSITFVGPNIWNNLPPSIKLSTSLSVFKSKLKSHLLEKYHPLQ